MARTLALVLVIVCFATGISFAQSYSVRSLYGQSLVLDDGNGHTYGIVVPPLSASTTYTLPLLPSPLGTAGYVTAGSTPGQTLAWDGSVWSPSSVLLNDGTNLTSSGSITMSGFKLTTGATTNYVLTSDANGVGTWQASTGLSGGTAHYIPIWSSANAESTSLLYQDSGKVGVNKTSSMAATLDVSGTGQYSGLLTANGGITMGGTLGLASQAITADTGKSCGIRVLVATDITHGDVDIPCANVTSNSIILLTVRRPSATDNVRPFPMVVKSINTSNHTFHVSFLGADFATGDMINWLVIN